MAPKPRILRTLFPGDTFRVDDKLTIDSDGVEVPETKADEILELAARSGARVIETEADKPAKNEGSAGQ